MTSDHAIDRAKERYGVEVTRMELRRLATALAKGTDPGIRLLRRWPVCEWWLVHPAVFGKSGPWMLCVFDRAGHRVRTFLRMNAVRSVKVRVQ